MLFLNELLDELQSGDYFLLYVLVSAIAISVIFAIIGTIVSMNKLVFIAGGVSHASFGGVGIGFLLAYHFGWKNFIDYSGPIYSALVFAMFVATVIYFLTRHQKRYSDAVIGAMWALGMAIGVICIERVPGLKISIESYLFGSILYVNSLDTIILCILAVILSILFFVFYKTILSMSYDEEFASIRGIPVNLLYFITLQFISIAIVLSINFIGIILVIALLTMAPYIMERFLHSMKQIVMGAIVLNLIFCICGLAIAYQFDMNTGPCIVVFAAIIFFISISAQKVLKKA
ncbi:MAG: metal ABC transporter permease [Lentisphaeria bacterium]|nr:metal ABC transporter permease [Lentisphaeria bacterium]NQZ67644.1 metal ABC transporter permease [Lentisphaeria bacterium]